MEFNFIQFWLNVFWSLIPLTLKSWDSQVEEFVRMEIWKKWDDQSTQRNRYPFLFQFLYWKMIVVTVFLSTWTKRNFSWFKIERKTVTTIIFQYVNWERNDNLFFWGTFLSTILNQMEFRSVKSRKDNCHHHHIPFILRENVNLIFSILLNTQNVFKYLTMFN